MLLIHCQRLTSRYGIRNISTSVSKNLMKEYHNPEQKKRLRSTALYMTGLGILVAGLSYAAVPLYRIFCQVYFQFTIVIIFYTTLKYFILSLIYIT